MTLDELTTPLSRQEVQASIYDVLATLGVNTTSWKPGGVVRTMIVAASIVLAALSELQAQIARSGFLELSEGEWLTLVARYVYGVEREGATFATGEVTLTNSGGGVYLLDPDDLIVLNPSTSKTYRNTDTVTLGAFATETIAIRATEVGASSTAAPGAIDTLSTTLTGVTCSNDFSVVGRDAENDAALRARCSEKLGSLSPMGPWDSYAYAARSAKRADGSGLGITRVRLTKDGYGNVYVYLATATGGVLGTVGDLSTDLGVADRAIQQFAAPEAVTAHTISATAVPLAVTCEVWMYNTAGLTDLQAISLIEQRLIDFMRAQPLGGNVIGADPGKVFVDAIRATIAATVPEIFHVVVTVPAGDTTLTVSQVPVFSVPLTCVLHQVPPPEGFGA